MEPELNQKQRGFRLTPLPPFHLIGAALAGMALVLLLFGSSLFFVPLILLALLILAAPFWPRAQLFLPLICHGPRDQKKVALTFDDGPDPETTPRLLDLLGKHSVKATFFVIGQKTLEHPELVRAILDRGHEVANHSQSHDPILMLRTKATLFKEINDCQQTLGQFGIRPKAFRPPVGITNPKLGPVLRSLGMYGVVFDCKGGDVGNRKVEGLAGRILGRVNPGSIIVMHDRRPAEGVSVDVWLKEVEAVLEGLRQKGFKMLPLSESIGRPVMEAGGES